MFWGSGVVLLGVFLLTYRSISKPLDYLDEVIEAAEELAHPQTLRSGFRLLWRVFRMS